jgi:hypothetical protein
MKVVQCTLRHEDKETNTTTTTVGWIEKLPELKKWVYVTLKDTDHPEWRWLVTDVGSVVMDKDKIHRTGGFFDSDI